MNSVSLQRYELRRVLGRGGTGVVYEAYDARAKCVVALKTIESSLAENLYRLKQEFRALSDVQHPNLVRFDELSSDDGQWYFTMELVDGTSFIEYVRPGVPARVVAESRDAAVGAVGAAADDAGDVLVAESGTVAKGERALGAPAGGDRLDEAKLRAALPQLVSALGAIHDAGHVHRDVKPSNVLVTHEGRLVLLDFGLVAARKDVGRRSDSGMLGTPAFMAPEQIEGAPVGPAADWYAMGAMIFLALTRTLPHPGTTKQILEGKLTREAPSARSVAPGVPADLDALCTALLRMDPAQRPTADEIRRLLETKSDVMGSGKMRAAEPATVFIGREREMESLHVALGRGEAPTARLAIVEGEPGVGKSALANAFLEGLDAATTVLSGRCYEQETVPFKGIDSILDALSEHLLGRSEEEIASLLEGGVRYLAAVFPVLNRVPAIAAATSRVRGVDNAAVLREQAFGEFERLVRALSERGPVVLFIDDLQWADRDSLALLQRTLVGPTAAPCRFLATMRTGVVDLSREAAELTTHAERILLGGLSESESQALWNALWPTETSRATRPEQRSAAMHEAAGHPLFLTELVRSARAGHHHAGAALQDVLWERVNARDETDRRFLEMVALAGAPTPLSVIATAANVEVGEKLARLGPLRAAQLVRVSRRGDERLVEPYHDRIRESILLHVARADGGASMNDRRLRLGRALLEGLGDDALAQRVFAIVQHMNAARDAIEDVSERRRLVALNLLAARQARLATAYEQAAGYARVGLELVGETGWTDAYEATRDLHVERMNAEFLAGNDDVALACFDAARQRLTTLEDRTDLDVALITLQTGRGRFVEALDVGRRALADLHASLPARAMLVNVLVQYTLNRIVQRGRGPDELLHLPLIDDRLCQSVLTLLVSLAPPAFFCDTNLLTWVLLRIAYLSMRFGVSNMSSYGFAGYGLALSGAFAKHEEGAEFGRLSLALNERFQNHALGAKLHLLSGFMASWVNPFAAAKEFLRAGRQLGLKIGDTSYECYNTTVLSVVSFCESAELASLRAVADEATEVAVRRMDRDMAGVPEAHARYAAALCGLTPSTLDLGTAASSDAEFRESLSDASTPTALFYYFFCNAELRYHFGDTDTARALLVEAKKRTQGIFALPTTLELCFLDALVMARQHDRAGALGRFGLRFRMAANVRKLRAWARSSPANFEAHALIAEAELARIRGRSARATALFERSVTAARVHKSAKREAMALELAAAHARAIGDHATADRLTRESIDAYRRWGAVAKCLGAVSA